MYRRRFPLDASNVQSATKRLQIKPDESSKVKNYEHQLHYPNFLSHRSTSLLYSAYNSHLRTVAELAFGTAETFTQAQKDLFRIVEAAERGEGRLKNPRLLHHASQAWNLEFFLRGLTTEETVPSDFVLNILSRDFGSFDNFQRTFKAHASAMIGCGWIWLVKREKKSEGGPDSDLILQRESKLSILTTFNGASPLFKTDNNSNSSSSQHPTNNSSNTQISTVQNSPILGLNLWESAFILDYGLDRDRFVNNWWKVINWNLASVLLTK